MEMKTAESFDSLADAVREFREAWETMESRMEELAFYNHD